MRRSLEEFYAGARLVSQKSDYGFNKNRINLMNRKSFNFNYHVWDTEAILKKVNIEGRNYILHNFNFGYIYNGEKFYHFENVKDFIDYFLILNELEKEVTVYAHNLEYDIQLLNPFKAFYDKGYFVENFSFTSAQFITFRKDDRRIKFYSTTNFFKVPLKKLGSLIDLKKLDDELEVEFTPEFYEKNKEKMHEYCRRDCEIVFEVLKNFKTLLLEHDFGDISITAPATALRVFRSCFLKRPINRFRPENVKKDEYKSYYGGRTECFFIGMKENVYYLDVNSMYPHVMSDNYYPIKYQETVENETLENMHRRINNYGLTAIAKVTLNTKLNLFPYRDEKLTFPIGKFTTTLCTPELLLAYEKNSIEKIEYIHYYKSSQNLFDEYIKEMYHIREKYKKEGNEVGSTVFKLLMNSLYGKFGQKEMYNKRVAVSDNFVFSDYYVYDEDDDDEEEIREVHLRQIGHDIFEVIRSEDETDTAFTAIAAHVTSYARALIGKYMQEVKDQGGHVYYMDTDSLMVDKNGYKILKKYIDPYKLGFLDVEYDNFTVFIHGPKDYKISFTEENKNDIIRLKGIKNKSELIAENTYKQHQFQRFLGFLKTGYMRSEDIIKQIRKNPYDKGIIEPDGFVKPFKMG